MKFSIEMVTDDEFNSRKFLRFLARLSTITYRLIAYLPFPKSPTTRRRKIKCEKWIVHGRLNLLQKLSSSSAEISARERWTGHSYFGQRIFSSRFTITDGEREQIATIKTVLRERTTLKKRFTGVTRVPREIYEEYENIVMRKPPSRYDNPSACCWLFARNTEGKIYSRKKHIATINNFIHSVFLRRNY